MTWVYKQTEPQLYTVGFYQPDGTWIAESDHSNPAEASAQVHYLNGGRQRYARELLAMLETIVKAIHLRNAELAKADWRLGVATETAQALLRRVKE